MRYRPIADLGYYRHHGPSIVHDSAVDIQSDSSLVDIEKTALIVHEKWAAKETHFYRVYIVAMIVEQTAPV